jgi:hypothetical protein
MACLEAGRSSLADITLLCLVEAAAEAEPVHKSLMIAVFATALLGAPAATLGAGSESPAEPPGHPALHGSSSATADRITLPPGVKPYESGKVNPNLTEQECGALGGAVHGFDFCLSGRGCLTTDETGQEHLVCISKNAS